MLYGYLAYGIERSDFWPLAGVYSLIFFLTFYFYQINREHWPLLLVAALLFRLCLMPVLPWLSQDYFRFIWDGRLIGAGLNPYLYLPDDLMKTPGFALPQAQELYIGMGSLSAGHYTNYPPFNQFLFYLGSLIGNQSIFATIIFFRIIIILADFGIFYFGRKILLHFKLQPNLIFWYLLNPLVITELTGNLHFEGVMLFFLVLSFYWTLQNKWLPAALAMAVSISTKLLPLLLLPVFFQYWSWKRCILYYFLVIGLNVLLFLPFLSTELVTHFSQSIGLWFTNFEFNASLYYLIREVGFLTKGYNIIQTTGKVMPVLMVVLILGLSVYRKHHDLLQVLQTMTLIAAIYFFQSTTVHPWYITNLVLLAALSGYRFPLVWSLTAILSYYAYSIPGFKENPVLLLMEYLPVYFVFIKEVFYKNKTFSFRKIRPLNY